VANEGANMVSLHDAVSRMSFKTASPKKIAVMCGSCLILITFNNQAKFLFFLKILSLVFWPYTKFEFTWRSWFIACVSAHSRFYLLLLAASLPQVSHLPSLRTAFL
jgi:hypothetical protein